MAVVVVKWSACLPSTLAIRFQTRFNLQFLFCLVLKRTKIHKKRRNRPKYGPLCCLEVNVLTSFRRSEFKSPEDYSSFSKTSLE